jgi:hypothetical protein
MMMMKRTGLLAMMAVVSSAALSACKSDPCGDFYDVYEQCGFAESGGDAQSRSDCEDQTSKSDTCGYAYENLNDCIEGLGDACTYPSACEHEIQVIQDNCL